MHQHEPTLRKWMCAGDPKVSQVIPFLRRMGIFLADITLFTQINVTWSLICSHILGTRLQYLAMAILDRSRQDMTLGRSCSKEQFTCFHTFFIFFPFEVRVSRETVFCPGSSALGISGLAQKPSREGHNAGNYWKNLENPCRSPSS